MTWLLNLLGPVGVFIKFGLSLLSGNAGSILKTALDYWAHKSDVEVTKLQALAPALEQTAVAALNAQVQASAIKADLAKTILNSPWARFFVALLIGIVSVRFALIVFDSTWWSVWGCNYRGAWTYGDKCSWNIAPIKGIYGSAEMEILLFWIVAKPIDSAVQGAMNILTTLVRKNG